MAMNKTSENLGEIEELVLLAILRLGDDAYGVPIIHEIAGRAGREVAPAAVYVALRRLRHKELVTSRTSAPEPVPGGRARRYFSVTKAGIELLAQSRQKMLRMWEGLQPLLEKR